MLKKIIITLLLIVFSATLYANDFCRVKDAQGNDVVLKRPARRIIALAPNLTEIVFVAGAGNYLVGVSNYSDYPIRAKKIPIIANYNDLDIEKIIALRPDLVIAWQGGNPIAQINKLRKLGIPVYVSSFQDLTDIAKNIRVVGKLVGTEERANKAAKLFMQQYLTLKQKYANKKTVKVFYELSLHPLITLNKRTIVGQVIRLCGGKNIFADLPILAPHVNFANVLDENPQVIFVSGQLVDDQDISRGWSKYHQLSAVKNQQIFIINANLLERYGPRVLKGAKQICSYIDLVRKKGASGYAWHFRDNKRFFA